MHKATMIHIITMAGSRHQSEEQYCNSTVETVSRIIYMGSNEGV